MTYIIIALLLIVSVYPLSYVRYVWQKKNYAGAVAVLLLTLASIAAPACFLFSR